MTLVLAVFLAAHGLMHVSYLTPAPPRTADGPPWPFDLGRSRLTTALGVDPAVVRRLGIPLVAATIGLFLASALATLGWLPASWWSALVVGGASTSLVTLMLFFHPWQVLGIAIDAILLWAVRAAGWVPLTAHGA